MQFLKYRPIVPPIVPKNIATMHFFARAFMKGIDRIASALRCNLVVVGLAIAALVGVIVGIPAVPIDGWLPKTIVIVYAILFLTVIGAYEVYKDIVKERDAAHIKIKELEATASPNIAKPQLQFDKKWNPYIEFGTSGQPNFTLPGVPHGLMLIRISTEMEIIGSMSIQGVSLELLGRPHPAKGWHTWDVQTGSHLLTVHFEVPQGVGFGEKRANLIAHTDSGDWKRGQDFPISFPVA